MTTVSGFFNSDDSPNVYYEFSYLDDNGMFEYEITDGDLDEEGTKNILGLLFLREPSGLCTWEDLPKTLQEDFAKKLTSLQLLKAQLVAKTAYCEGSLVFCSHKSDWDEVEFKAKMMIREARRE